VGGADITLLAGALLGIVLIVVSLLGGHDGAGGPEAAVSTSEGGSG
jgi:hypothetical protein